MLAYFSGVYLFATSLAKNTFTVLLLTLALLASVPILSFLGTVTKDNFLLCILMLLIGCICRYEQSAGKIWMLLATLLLVYVTELRHNAILLTVPLSFWAALVFFPARNLAGSALRGIAYLGLIMTLSWSANAAIKAIYKTNDSHAWQQILLLDLAGMSLSSGEMLLPNRNGLTYAGVSLEELRTIYDPFNVVTLYWVHDKRLPFFLGQQAKRKVTELRTAWLSAVTDNPLMYVEQRLELSSRTFGWSELCGTDGTYQWQNSWGYTVRDSLLLQKLQRISSSAPALFRGWIYLLILGLSALISLIQACFCRRIPASFWVATAGLAYMLAYILIAPVCFFRLLLPGILCAHMALILVLSQIPAFWRKTPYCREARCSASALAGLSSNR